MMASLDSLNSFRIDATANIWLKLVGLSRCWLDRVAKTLCEASQLSLFRNLRLDLEELEDLVYFLGA